MKVKIADLITDGLQARAEMCEAIIDDYAIDIEAGAPFPPIIVFKDDDGTLRLADGFHRVAAAQKLGIDEFEAEIRKGGEREAVYCAACSNQQHGLRRTNADKRNAARIVLEQRPTWSDRAIAKAVGVSDFLVRDTRSRCENLAPEPPAAAEDKSPTLDGKGANPVQDEACAEDPHKLCGKSAQVSMPPKRVGLDGKSYPAPEAKEEKAVTDMIGRRVPPELVGLWNRREEIKELLAALSKVRSTVKMAGEKRDPLYFNTDTQRVWADLCNAYGALKLAAPYAVCPTCQGKVPEQCKMCGGAGLISQMAWENTVTREKRELIKAQIRKEMGR